MMSYILFKNIKEIELFIDQEQFDIEYYMKKCPIPVTQTDKYDHELLSRNAGEI